MENKNASPRDHAQILKKIRDRRKIEKGEMTPEGDPSDLLYARTMLPVDTHVDPGVLVEVLSPIEPELPVEPAGPTELVVEFDKKTGEEV